MNLNRLRLSIGLNWRSMNLRLLATEAKAEAVIAEKVELSPEENEIVEKALELEHKRNKSGLNKFHYNVLHGRQPYDEPKHYIHFTVEYHRKMFGRYGMKTGLNPGYCFMSKDEIEIKKEYERVAFPYTIQEAIEKIKTQKKEERDIILARDERIAKNMANMNKWMEEMAKRNQKKLDAANEIKMKKEKIIEEIRRQFGFKIDPKDERFKKVLEEKEKEQKKAEKIAKKAAREAKALLRLQQMNAEIVAETTNN